MITTPRISSTSTACAVDHPNSGKHSCANSKKRMIEDIEKRTASCDEENSIRKAALAKKSSNDEKNTTSNDQQLSLINEQGEHSHCSLDEDGTAGHRGQVILTAKNYHGFKELEVGASTNNTIDDGNAKTKKIKKRKIHHPGAISSSSTVSRSIDVHTIRDAHLLQSNPKESVPTSKEILSPQTIGGARSPPPAELDDSKPIRGMNQYERKRYREKKRRGEMANAIDQLKKVLVKVAPGNFFIGEDDHLYTVNSGHHSSSIMRNAGDSPVSNSVAVGQQPLNRIQIIKYATDLLHRNHSDSNDEGKMHPSTTTRSQLSGDFFINNDAARQTSESETASRQMVRSSLQHEDVSS